MTAMDQLFSGCELGRQYPYPIVNVEESARIARAKIWGHREHPIVQQEKTRLLFTHTRRKK